MSFVVVVYVGVNDFLAYKFADSSAEIVGTARRRNAEIHSGKKLCQEICVFYFGFDKFWTLTDPLQQLANALKQY